MAVIVITIHHHCPHAHGFSLYKHKTGVRGTLVCHIIALLLQDQLVVKLFYLFVCLFALIHLVVVLHKTCLSNSSKFYVFVSCITAVQCKTLSDPEYCNPRHYMDPPSPLSTENFSQPV